MKGLQGEPRETLEGIRLSISTIEKLFQSYSTYCSNSTPTLVPVGAGMVRVCLAPSTPAPCPDGPFPLPGGAASLGFLPLPCLQENRLLLAEAQEHRGDSRALCQLPLPWGCWGGPMRAAQGGSRLLAEAARGRAR